MADDWNNLQDTSMLDIVEIIKKRILLKEIKVYEKQEERLWQQYLVLYAQMDKKTYKSYIRFLKESKLEHPLVKKEKTEDNIKDIPKNEVIDIALRIKSNDKRELKKKGG